jgi:peroxiredoxin
VRRIAQLRERFDQLQARNLDVLIVLCQKRDKVVSWLKTHPLPFPILIDDDRSRAKRWGVYVRISYDSVHMARPASFVVDAAGIVRYARVARNQFDAAPIADTLTAAT